MCFAIILSTILNGSTSSWKFLHLPFELLQVKTVHEEKRLDTLVDRDLRSSFDADELENAVKLALLCTQSNPVHRPKMSEVVKVLESGSGMADNIEEQAESLHARSCSISRSYDDHVDESSFIIEAIELSGPR